MAEYENTQYTDEMEFEVPKKSRETIQLHGHRNEINQNRSAGNK